MKAKGKIIHFVISKIGKEISCVSKYQLSSYCFITGETKQLIKAMKNASFKILLHKFLVEYWKDNSLVHLIGEQIMHVKFGDIFYKYQVVPNFVVCSNEARLYRNQKEGDSRMSFHVSCLAENYSSASDVNVVLGSADRDSFIIAVGGFQNLLEKHQKLRLWFEMGVEKKKKKKYIAICQRELNTTAFGSAAFFSFSFLQTQLVPLFSKSLFPLPYFLFHPLLRYFRQFPLPSHKFLLL